MDEALFSKEDWLIVNDGVMGGCSQSSLHVTDEGLTFNGDLSTDNSGGFVSFRGQLPRSVTNFSGVNIEASGDSGRYQLRLRETNTSSGIAWRAFLDISSTRENINLSAADFEPVYRGKVVNDTTLIQQTPIHFLGFMLTSQEPGPFSLELFNIEICTSISA